MSYSIAFEAGKRSDEENNILQDAKNVWNGVEAKGVEALEGIEAEYDELINDGNTEGLRGAQAIRAAKGREFEPTGGDKKELVISEVINGIATNHANSDATEEIKDVRNLAVPPDQATLLDGVRYEPLLPPDNERERRCVVRVPFDEAFLTGEAVLDLRGYSIQQITKKVKRDIPLQFFSVTGQCRRVTKVEDAL